jgi:hypothetical protein
LATREGPETIIRKTFRLNVSDEYFSFRYFKKPNNAPDYDLWIPSLDAKEAVKLDFSLALPFVNI